MPWGTGRPARRTGPAPQVPTLHRLRGGHGHWAAGAPATSALREHACTLRAPHPTAQDCRTGGGSVRGGHELLTTTSFFVYFTQSGGLFPKFRATR